MTGIDVVFCSQAGWNVTLFRPTNLVEKKEQILMLSYVSTGEKYNFSS